MRTASIFLVLAMMVLSWAYQANAFSFNNPLVDAADIGDRNKVYQLIKNGTSPDSKGDFGVTPLMRAAFRGHTDIVELLIESGAYVNASDVGGETALHLAARNGHTEVIDILLKYDAYIDIPDKEKWTPLMRAIMAGKTDTVNFLINKGADLTAVNEMDESAIVHASMTGKADIMKLILGSNNFAKIPESQRKTASLIADKKGNETVGRMLAATIQHFKQEKLQNQTQQPWIAENREVYIQNTPTPKPTLKKQDTYAEAQTETLPWQQPDQPAGVPQPPIKAPDYNMAEMTQDQPWQNIDTDWSYSKNPDFSNQRPPEQPYTSTMYDGASFYTMQLGAFSTEEQAFFVWNNLKRKNADLLENFSPGAMSTVNESDGRQMFRLRAGVFKWQDVAESSCSSLRARNIECIVVKGSEQQYNLANKFEKYTPYEPAPQQLQQPQQYAQNNYDYNAPTDPNSPIDIVPARNPRAQAPGDNNYNNGYPQPQTRPQPAQQQQPQYPPAPQQAYSAAPEYAQPQQYAQYQQPPQAQNTISDELPWMQDPNYQPRQDWQLPQQQYTAPAAPQYNPYQQAPTPYDAQQYTQATAPPAYQQPQQLANIDRQSPPAMTSQPEQNYDNFYKQIENNANNRGPVYEAILVPDEVYFPKSKTSPANSGTQIWLQISSFANKSLARDYGIRMFKYDEDLKDLELRLFDTPTPYGNQITLRAGPLFDSITANSLCSTIKSGGIQCVLSDEQGRPASNIQQASPASTHYTPMQNPDQSNSAFKYWINLGTFADSSEAEYYWSFLKEDNNDLLANLRSNMADAGEHGEFSDQAVQLKVGPFTAPDRASQICNVMRYRNIACLVGQ